VGNSEVGAAPVYHYMLVFEGLQKYPTLLSSAAENIFLVVCCWWQ
jgi:hypothetical protein